MRAGRFALGLLLLLLFSGLIWTGQRGKGPAVDEVIQVAVGYANLTTADFRMDPANPPLAKELSALPLLGLGLQSPPFEPFGPEAWRLFRRGQDFLHFSGQTVDRLLVRARLVPLALALGLAGVAWAWGGLAALAFIVGCPTLAAFGGIATTDLPLAAFWVTALFLWARHLKIGNSLGRAPAWGRAVAAGAALGAAMATKFTGDLLVPVMAVAWWQARREGRRIEVWPAVLAAAAVIALAYQGQVGQYLHGHAVAAGLVGAGFPTYLNGEVSATGFRTYFLQALLMKSTLPFLLLCAWAGVRARRWGVNETLLLGSAAILLIAGSLSPTQTGFRYILPALPCLAIWLGWCLSLRVARETTGWPGGGGLGRVVFGALLAWHLAEGVRAQPHPLAYFNQAAGGTVNGWRHLVDSNCDWGQDLPALRRWMDDHPGGIALSYFGSDEPFAYGIRYRDAWSLNRYPDIPGSPSRPPLAQPATTGTIRYGVVSATNLAGVYLPGDPFAALRARPPAQRITPALFVYDLAADPVARRVFLENP